MAVSNGYEKGSAKVKNLLNKMRQYDKEDDEEDDIVCVSRFKNRKSVKCETITKQRDNGDENG